MRKCVDSWYYLELIILISPFFYILNLNEQQPSNGLEHFLSFHIWRISTTFRSKVNSKQAYRYLFLLKITRRTSLNVPGRTPSLFWLCGFIYPLNDPLIQSQQSFNTPSKTQSNKIKFTSFYRYCSIIISKKIFLCKYIRYFKSAKKIRGDERKWWIWILWK